MSFFDYLDTNTELATVCNNAMTAMSATAMDAWSLRTTTPALSAPWMSAEATASYTPHPHAEVDHSRLGLGLCAAHPRQYSPRDVRRWKAFAT